MASEPSRLAVLDPHGLAAPNDVTELRSVTPPERDTASITAVARERAAEPVAFIAIMVSFGALVLWMLVRHFIGNGINEVEERRLYLLTSVLAPPLALGGGWVVSRARRAFLPESVVFPVAMALANTLFWVVALYVFKRTAIGRDPAYPRKFTLVANLFFLTNAVTLVGCLLGQRVRLSLLQRQVLRRFADDAYFLLPLAGAFAVGTFSNYDLTRVSTVAALAACGLPALARYKSRTLAVGLGSRTVLDVAALVLIAFAVFDPSYTFDELHFGFFLGPTASLLGGRRPLVDLNCQYGVGVVYFLASVFKLRLVPPSYQGMSAILSVLGIVHFTIIYALLRLCLRSRGYCFLALVVMLAVRVFSGPAQYVQYPSLGPLRFLWGYVLLLCIVLAERYPQRAKWFVGLELATVALTSIWSAESFAGCLAAFLAITFYEVVFHEVGRFSSRLIAGLKIVGWAVLAIGLAQGLLAMEIRRSTGHWPDWSQYFAYLILYSKVDAFWALPITTWEPWAPIVLIYFASLVALVARRVLFGQKTIRTEHKVIWGMTVLGIVEFSHYIGRSHVDHLRIYLAYLFIAAYWMDRIARPSPWIPNAFRTSFLYCAYAAIGLTLFSATPNFAKKFANSALGRAVLDRPIISPWMQEPDAPWAGQPRLAHLREEATGLIRRYQPEGRRVALFINEYIRPLVLMEVGKAHVWPLSLTEQDSIEPTARARTLAYPDGLKEGDIIFVADGLPALENELIAGLRKRFRFDEIDASPSGLKVIRLHGLAH